VLAVLTAVTIVAAMRVVGVLLVAALMVLPVATSRLLARSFAATTAGAVGVGIASVIIGLGSARVWELAPGGEIVLTTGVFFAVTAAGAGVARRTGVGPVLPP
jgi:zinc transport system permease protein